MSRCLVTGAAGFVGSHLCEQLIAAGHSVVGARRVHPLLPAPDQRAQPQPAARCRGFHFHELDLRTADLAPVLTASTSVFHVAAMAGLLKSWQQFDQYVTCNILATQRLLDAAVAARCPALHPLLDLFRLWPLCNRQRESPLAPVSPYGITKLAAEQLCRAYGQKDGLACHHPAPLSPSTARASAPTWAITSLSASCSPANRSWWTATAPTAAATPLCLTACAASDPGGRPAAPQRRPDLQHRRRRRGQCQPGAGDARRAYRRSRRMSRYGPPRPGDQRRTVADTAKAQRCLAIVPHGGARRASRPGGVAACRDGSLTFCRTPAVYAARRSVTVTTLGSTKTVPSGSTRVGTRWRAGGQVQKVVVALLCPG